MARERTGICCIATAVIGGVTDMVGAGEKASAAKSAAQAQEQAAASANQLLSQQNQQTQSYLQPYRDAGSADLTGYNNLLSDNGSGQFMSTLNSLPGFQFAQTQGLKAAQNSAAARGLGVSGAALKGASTFATGLAEQNYSTYANQLLAGAQLGETAANQSADYGTKISLQQGDNLVGAGNASAAGTVGAANAYASGITGLGNAASNALLLGNMNNGGLYGSTSAPYTDTSSWASGPPAYLYGG